MQLSAAQIEQFEKNGFLIVENALDDADIGPVIAEYEGHIDRRAHELLAEGKITQLHEEAPFGKRLALICDESMDIYPEMDIYRLRAKAAFEFLGNANRLDIIEGIVGPEITCNPAQHLPAQASRPVDVGSPWPRGCLASGHGRQPRGIGPALHSHGVGADDGDKPGERLSADPAAYPRQRPPGARQDTGIVDRHRRRGDARHRASLTGDGERLSVADGQAYFPPVNDQPIEWDTMEYGPSLPENGTPSGRPFYPDFVVRSRSNPDSVLTEHGEWVRLWERALDAEALAEQEGRKIEHLRWDEDAAAAH